MGISAEGVTCWWLKGTVCNSHTNSKREVGSLLWKRRERRPRSRETGPKGTQPSGGRGAGSGCKRARGWDTRPSRGGEGAVVEGGRPGKREQLSGGLEESQAL